MRTSVALVADTFSEAFARKIFWGLFGLSTAMILFFVFLVNIDVVQGVSATVELFGTPFKRVGINPDRLAGHIFGAVAAFLYTFGMALAIFASAGLMPALLEPGRIELLLSKPVSRVHLLLGRYVGNLLVVACNVVYLVIGVWLILAAKTGVWDTRFLAAIPTTLFVFAVLLAVVVLAGVLWESAAVATMIPVALIMMSPILAQKTTAEKLLSSEWSRAVWAGLYHATPKVFEIGRLTRRIALRAPAEEWASLLWSTAAFGVVVLAVSVWVFMRRDY